MSIVVLGANGQVGRALLRRFDARPLSRPDVDYTHPPTVLRELEGATLVLNAAAYTQVDKAESEPELAHRVNAELPGALAAWCAEHNARLVHFSTDYVYPGTGTAPWPESTPMAPINEYGRSKAEGDRRIMASGCDYLIFRTSWVYDASGQNFVRTMLRLFAERDTVCVVDDQVGAPTFALDLADAVVLARHAPRGVYNACNAGETTWYDFAAAILAETGRKVTLQRLKTADWKGPAPRPLNSRLDCSRLRGAGVSLRDWRPALRDCLEAMR